MQEVEPPPPLEVDDQGIGTYEVESIVRHRGKGRRKEYLVVWKGYPLHEATWLKEEDLINAQDALADYLRAQDQLEQAQRRRR